MTYAMVGLLFLAVYAALREEHGSAALVAVASSLVGIGIYFASNLAFALLSLSNRYAAATSDAQRATLAAAGEARPAGGNPRALYQGTGVYLSLLLVTLAGLVFSAAMLQSWTFGQLTAYVGLLANLFLLGYLLTLFLAPALQALPMVVSAPLRIVWYTLMARRLLQLASAASAVRTQPRPVQHA